MVLNRISMDKRLWTVLACALLGAVAARRWLGETHPTGLASNPRAAVDTGSVAAGTEGPGEPPLAEGRAQRSVAARTARQEGRSDTSGEGETKPVPAVPRGQRFLILDARTEVPLVDFQISVTPSGPGSEAFAGRTSSAGIIQAPDPIPPGIVDVEHLPDPDHDEYGTPWKCTLDSLLVDAFEPDVGPRVLHFRPPLHCVRIAVVGSDGQARIGCPVTLTQGARGEHDAIPWRRWHGGVTDGSGVAHIYLHDERPGDTFAAVVDRPHLGELSDALPIEPPLRTTPYTIRTYPGAFLDVEVLVSAEATAEGVQAWSSPVDPRHRRRWEPRLTDESGKTRLGPLAAGAHTVQARRLPDRRIQASRTVDLLPNQVVELTLDLRRVPKAQLAVSGRVLDPMDQPARDIALAVRMDGGVPEQVFTDAAGRFEWITPKSGLWVTVDSGASLFNAPIEPERLRVPLGTTGLEFRIDDSKPAGLVIFSLVDDATGNPIPDSLDPAIILYREPSDRGRILARALFGPSDGVTEVEFVPHDDLRWVVHAPGYQEERGRIEPPIAGAPPPRIEVRMQPGFRREFHIRDANTAAPLGGVAIRRIDGGVLATTGSDGRAIVTAPAWPDLLRFDREGLVPHLWNSAGYWGEFDGAIWLEPRPDGSKAPR